MVKALTDEEKLLRRQIIMQFTIQRKFYADTVPEKAVEWNRQFLNTTAPHFPYHYRRVVGIDDITGRIETRTYPNTRFFSFNGCVYDMLIFAL